MVRKRLRRTSIYRSKRANTQTQKKKKRNDESNVFLISRTESEQSERWNKEARFLFYVVVMTSLTVSRGG